jgi:hypothetical protein
VTGRTCNVVEWRFFPKFLLFICKNEGSINPGIEQSKN